MIVEMPAGLTADRLPEFILPGGMDLAERHVGVFVYVWSWGGETATVRFDFVMRQVDIPDGAAQVLRDELAARLAGFGGPAPWDPAARQLLALAQSAVGIAIQDLTAGQVKALLAVILWELRAIGNDLTVRPLSEWVRRKPR